MNNRWKNILVTTDTSIIDALEVIDSEGLRLAIVTDSKSYLLGVITDGDIRRGLLKGISINDNVSEIMNVAPHVGLISTPTSELHRKIEDLDLLALPLVDDKKRIVGLLRLQDSFLAEHHANPVFLMAGGFGTRLKPLTNHCPKPLLKVGDKPILEITLLNFIKAGFVNFYISTHYMSEMIMEHFGDGSKWGVNITYVYEENPLGTGGALGLLPDDLPQLPLIMMNGDILTTVDFHKLINFHANESADATMCVREYEYQVPYGVIQGSDGKITSMVEKPNQLFHINAGIYVINPEIVKKVKLNEKVDMPTLLERKISEEGKVMMFPIHEYWLDIGRMEDYQRAQADIVNLGV